MLGSLYLFPSESDRLAVTAEAIATALARIGLIGPPRALAGGYLAGPRFPHLITFAGCSPHLPLTPTEDDAFCWIRVLGPYPAIRGYVGAMTRAPRCPACRQRAVDWQPTAAHAQPLRVGPWTCPACREITPWNRLDWRQQAAFGRLLVELRHIFPSEAMPAPGLLDALKDSTGDAWDFAWAGKSPI